MTGNDQSNRLLPYAILVVAVAAFAVFTALVFGSSGAKKGSRIAGGFGDKAVGIVEISGPIVASRPYLKVLERLLENDKVAAIVVRVDSPGGAVGPSQELYHYIRDIRDRKPVVISMGAVAASGGFYIASAGSKIVANAGTLTGSIGVIMAFPDLSDLLNWAKVKMEVVKTGQFKDTGSGYRPVTTAEREYLQNLIDEVLEQFIADIAAGRGDVVSVETIREVADGRVFTGATGQSLGLVDQLGGFPTAVSLAAQLGEIEGKPDIVEPRLGPPWYERVLNEGLDLPLNDISSRLMPLWAIWVP